MLYFTELNQKILDSQFTQTLNFSLQLYRTVYLLLLYYYRLLVHLLKV